MTRCSDESIDVESKPKEAVETPVEIESSAVGIESVPDQGALLALARLGDGEAFGELCRPHEARLRRQARYLVGDPVIADELAQDALVAAWRGLPRFDGRSRFSTWLCAILLFQHRRRLRREWGLRRWFSSGDSDPAVESATTSVHAADSGPVARILRAEQSECLERCLKELSPKHREVVVLRFYADESLEGIAAVLGISLGTVKSRLFHALEKLRKKRRELIEEAHRESQP